MKEINEKKMKQIVAGGGEYRADCPNCDVFWATSYTGVYGGLSWSTAKVVCEGKIRNHVIEVHYGNL